MNSKRTDSMILIVSICCFFLMSLSFLIMPLGSTQVSESVRWVPVLSGSLFWGFLILGVAMQVLLVLRRKKRFRSRRSAEAVLRPGVIRFFRTPLGVVSDVGVLISVVGVIVSLLLTDFRGYVCYVFIALLSFAFVCHCIFNGDIYYYIMYKNKPTRKISQTDVSYKQVKGEVEDYE